MISEEESISILAYCIMNNHAHMLLNTEHIEKLSRCMKRINTRYAQYYNSKYKRVGYVFRERYKAEGIYSEEQLYNCINYIHNNPVKARICKTPKEYPYSDCSKTFDVKESGYIFIDIDNDDTYMKVIEKYLRDNNLKINELLNKETNLKELIIELKRDYGISLRKIAQAMQINREKIRKIYNSQCQIAPSPMTPNDIWFKGEPMFELERVPERKQKIRMKYFKRGWFANPKDVNGIIEDYATYYKTIENQLSDNVKQVMKHRHDTHIVKAYIEGKDYVMELDEEIWGKAKFIFQNADVKINGKIEDEWWLYDEIYKVGDKIEIHILFDQADAIIFCDDAYIDTETKNYFKEVYAKEEFNMDQLYLDKVNILNIVDNKESICGWNMLNRWEQLLVKFIKIYTHINSYIYNNIENTMKEIYYDYSGEEQIEIYKQLFEQLEEDIKETITILNEYKNIIKDKDLGYVLDKLLEVYNKKNIPMKEKNQLYLNTNQEFKDIDFNKIYMRILDCINEGLIQ